MATLNRRNATRRYLAITLIALVMLTGVMTWLAFVAFRPTPPRSVTMAIDPEGSFNAVAAKRYRELLARDGIELKLLPSAGAVESVARLQDPKSDVSIAIIPSGITDEQKSPELVSLGTLFYEPLWVFSHGQVLQGYQNLSGLRISIGPEGSGSHALSTEFLAKVGIINQETATLLSFSAEESAAKLQSGEIDVAILLEAWETPVVHKLLTAKDINVDSVSRADAFVGLYPFLHKLAVPTGVAKMKENRQ